MKYSNVKKAIGCLAYLTNLPDERLMKEW